MPRLAFLLSLSACFVLAAGLGVIEAWSRLGNWLVVRDKLSVADVIVVLNGDVNYERTKEAVRLYRAEYAPRILVSGDVTMGPGDSALSMKAQALRLGVPERDILIEPRARSTEENARFVAPILIQHGFQKIILVTHPYHQRRAWFLSRRAWGSSVQIMNAPARHSFWSADRWWTRDQDRWIVFGEWMKLFYHWVVS